MLFYVPNSIQAAHVHMHTDCETLACRVTGTPQDYKYHLIGSNGTAYILGGMDRWIWER